MKRANQASLPFMVAAGLLLVSPAAVADESGKMPGAVVGAQLAEDQTEEGGDRKSLVIKVLGEDDGPVGGAEVSVKLGEERNIHRTNSAGVAKFPNLGEGLATVQVVASGFDVYGDTFQVPLQDEVLNVRLTKRQPAVGAGPTEGAD